MQINDLIIAIRKAKGWTTYKLAKEAGINIKSMYMIEKGDTNPNLGNVQKIAVALGVTITISAEGFGVAGNYPFPN